MLTFFYKWHQAHGSKAVLHCNVHDLSFLCTIDDEGRLDYVDTITKCKSCNKKLAKCNELDLNINHVKLITCLVFYLMCLLIGSQEYSEKINLMKKFKSVVIWYHLWIFKSPEYAFWDKIYSMACHFGLRLCVFRCSF